jgi:hypothetical protein
VAQCRHCNRAVQCQCQATGDRPSSGVHCLLLTGTGRLLLCLRCVPPPPHWHWATAVVPPVCASSSSLALGDCCCACAGCRFVQDWDELCLRELRAAQAAGGNEHIVLSTYPGPYSGQGAAAVLPDDPPTTLLCATRFDSSGLLRIQSR